MIDKVRETVREIAPYKWEASSAQIAKRFGLRESDVKRFDMNTSPFQAKLRIDVCGLNEYPNPSCEELTQAIAEYAGVGSKQVVIGAGADEILDVIAKTFIDNGDAAIVSTPTYSMYRIVVEQMGGRVLSVPREKDFSINNQKILEAANDAKAVFVCNPNSPTGNFTPVSEIKELSEATQAPVVVDEAYYEFCGETIARNEVENAIVVRTFSKAFSLAGARVGYAIASEEVAAEMNKVRPPNSVSTLSIRLALKALEKQEEMRDNVQKIVSERGKLQREFEKLGLFVYPSETNFLLVKFAGENAAQSVFEALLASGIVVRNYAKKISGCLRVTIRSPSDNELLIERIKEVLEK